MNNKLTLLLLLTSLCSAGVAKTKLYAHPQMQIVSDTGRANDFPLLFKLPNNEWNAVVRPSPGQYLFKRNPITDSAGRRIIPAIMIYTEDAAGYKQDITIFSSQKMQPFLDRGVKVPKILSWQDKDYPLTFKNALFMRGTYSDGKIDHIIFMIYIIDKHDQGIQVYMDMTREIASKYESEFWTTIRSLKEKP
jgi:hypothetical protein